MSRQGCQPPVPKCWPPSSWTPPVYSGGGLGKDWELGRTLASSRRSLKAGERNPGPQRGRPGSREDLLASEQVPLRQECAVPPSIAWGTLKTREGKGVLVPWEAQMPVAAPPQGGQPLLLGVKPEPRTVFRAQPFS